MKRLLVGLVCLLWIICFGTSEAYVTVFPSFSLNNYPDVVSSYDPTSMDLQRAYSIPSFGTGGLNIDLDNLEIVVRLDLRQDFSAFLMGRDWSNLPISRDNFSPFVDANFPRIGYLEYKNDEIFVSVGRRKLKWGTATYDMAISSYSPYYDHLWFNTDGHTEYGELWYSYLALSSDRTVYNAPKTLLAHKVGLKNDLFGISIGEQNLVYGVYPDLQDLGPLILFHHTYQSHSNVMLVVSVDSLMREKTRIYGEFVMDDFRLKTESPDSKPNAMGWYVGVESKIVNGKLSWTEFKFLDEDYTLKEDGFSFEDGLRIRYEHYQATTYLYNRNDDIGKWTNPIRLNTMWLSAWPVIDSFFGFPYGPDTTLNLLGVKYNNGRLSANFTAEYLRKWSYTIDDTYEPPYSLDWLGPVEPVSKSFILSLSITYAIDPDSTILILANSIFSGDRSNYCFVIGYGKAFTF